MVLNITAANGYKVSKVYYFDTTENGIEENNTVELKANADGTWTLKMPGRNITLKAVFIEKGYAIVINGSAAADKQRADAGETVKITSSIADRIRET